MKTTKHLSKLLILMLLALGIATAGCKGPTGADGPQGIKGPQGKIGPAGKNGSAMLAGEGKPKKSQGKIGDFYLNTNTAELYGPKTKDGWGVPIALKGPKGDDGANGQDGKDGSQIYSGTSAPAASLGKVGDFYFNKSTFDLYGPKTDSGWGTPVNLQATTSVMYSAWFEPDWNQVDEARRKLMRITEFRLTPEFKQSGLVVVYRKNSISRGNIKIYQLPQTVYFVDGTIERAYQTYVEGNGIYIELNSFSEDLEASDYDAAHNKFRYVLIPGSQQISSAAPVKAPIDLKNYREVKKYFGLREGKSVHLSKQQ